MKIIVAFVIACGVLASGNVVKYSRGARKTILKRQAPADIHTVPPELSDEMHVVKMGVSHVDCDDGVTNTTTDWDGSPVNYTCYEDLPYPVKQNVQPVLECEEVPQGVSISKHLCMFIDIEYSHTEPVFGNHRPLWPMYGEYLFVPVQRWLHTLEHGGIVMLYHPCADPQEVEKLRQLVKGCIRRHVITPHNFLTKERPLALIVHTCRFYMSTVEPEAVRDFIRNRALQGREGYEVRDGQYSLELVVPAVAPKGSDYKDSVLCPNQ